MSSNESGEHKDLLADGELARRLRHGEEDAWAVFVERYQRKIWHVAFQFTARADEAEELTQEIFLHLMRALKSFDDAGSLPAWTQRVARNYAIDHYRKRRRERSLVDGGEAFDDALRGAHAEDATSSPERSLEQSEISEWLRDTIRKLPSELAEAVILRDLQEMTYEEMAVTLNVPLGTVKSRINRGRVELARRLQRKRSKLGSGASRKARGGQR